MERKDKDHLSCGDDLGHDDEQVAGDDAVERVGAVAAVDEVGGADHGQAGDDGGHAEPLASLQQTAQKRRRQQAREDDHRSCSRTTTSMTSSISISLASSPKPTFDGSPKCASIHST